MREQAKENLKDQKKKKEAKEKIKIMKKRADVMKDDNKVSNPVSLLKSSRSNLESAARLEN